MNLIRHIRMACLIVTFSAITQTAFGQNQADYSVFIPASMSLEAMRPPDSATHPMTPANVVLSDSRWRARSSSTTGSTVTFRTDHSFWNLDGSGYKRDAIVRLTRLQGPPHGNWTIDVAQDQTDYANGDEVAQVTMSSTAPGMQMVRMEVEFVTGDLSTLRGGDYQLTVIGTITQNP